jgi:WD40 repeat protein
MPTPTPTTKLIVTTEDDISALCAHPTKPILACCDDSGVITIIDAAKVCVVRVLRKGGHTSLATCAVFLPLPADSSLLLSGGCDHTLKLWDGVSPEGAKGPLLTAHANALLAGAANGGGKGGGGAAAPSLEDLSEDDLLDSLMAQNAMSAAAPSKQSTYNPNPPFIHALSLLLEGNLVAVAFGNGSVGVVSITTPPTGAGGKARRRPTLTMHWHRRETYLSAACAVAALPRGYLLACGGKDSVIALWPWKEVVEGGEGREPIRAWQHTGGRRKPRKVNWMAVEGSRGVLVVADTSSSLSLYTNLGGV